MNCIQLLPFPTQLGWMALVMKEPYLRQIKFGFRSEIGLLRSIAEEFDVRPPKKNEKPWISRLQRFAEGQQVELCIIPIDLSRYTRFQTKVLTTCRTIPYGQTLTYGQLAGKTGSPRAARAVGTTMKMNRYPLVVPCHRVVSSSGIGGYSAGNGIKIKAKLLAMEGVTM